MPETDKIFEKSKSLNWLLVQSKEHFSLTDCLSSFASEIYQKEFYLFIDEDWKYCGAIKTPKHTQINSQFNFDKNTSDELRFFSTDFSIQATIDYSDHGDAEPYECTIRRPLQTLTQDKKQPDNAL